jgi:NADH-quinone oxidoreductase subunit M
MSLYLILIPLIGSLVVFFLKGKMAWQVALAVALAELATFAMMATGFSQSDAQFQFGQNIPWIPESGINLSLGADGISMVMLLLTTLLTPFIILASSQRSYSSEGRYYGLLLLMLAALVGVFMARDGLVFYVFYELALIPIYFICAIWGGEDRIKVTLKFFIYTFAGSLLMLIALIFLYLQTPAPHSFSLEALQSVALDNQTALWIFSAFFIAFAIKMPVFPLHTWQPDTYTTSPVGGTMLLSGIMLKMGAYGAIRFMMPMAPEAMAQAVPICMSLAVVGIVYTSIIAIRQTDVKRLIAYSSIAHVGLIAAGILAWNRQGVQGSMIQMLNHGINVVGMFFIADLLERRYNTRSLNELGGIAKHSKFFAATFLIILLGTVAVPLTNGFPGEFLLLQGVWEYNNWLGALAGLTIIFGAVYMLRVYQMVMFGETNTTTEHFTALNLTEKLVLGTLAALVLLLGFFPQPVLDLSATAVDTILGLVQ